MDGNVYVVAAGVVLAVGLVLAVAVRVAERRWYRRERRRRIRDDR